MNGNHQPSQDQDKFSTTVVTSTAPIEIQLKSQFKTRYGVWCGIFILFVAALAAVIWRNGAVEWLLLTVTSLIIVYSGIVPIIATTKLSYNRIISEQYSHDGNLQFETRLRRTFRIPGMWYVIHESYRNQSQLNSDLLQYRASFTPLFHGEMILNYQLQQVTRGNYEALVTEIIVGDWLGLTSITVKKTLQQKFTVLPPIITPQADSFVVNNSSNRWIGDWNVGSDGSSNQQNMSDQSDLQSITLQDQGTYYSSQQQNASSGTGNGTRPYIEGDSYRRIDIRAAARGRGWHTKLQDAELHMPKYCIILDQYALPYQDNLRNQLFESMVQWSVADVHDYGQEQPVFVITDDWSFEYATLQHSYELRCLLALAKADVQQHIRERLPQLAVLIPQQSHIVLYSGDWRETESWYALADIARSKGCTLEIHFATNNRVMTYAMREQQRSLEQSGVKLVWRYSQPLHIPISHVVEGSERYASS
ncbi:DUF58 domain-containing protein [Paenibacillus endoradicis]|uniref:DUF58 domain-containing protein n=1 Tax=Paenibacillus endoradicis TaxID=2972487 RepID=UPI0021590224|nr:DUF58 domain-containing protein [Paenibacillus endoradicis]MCR8660116.1 DUF58 domain-containing protein [Paenibacillus endoradicis]